VSYRGCRGNASRQDDNNNMEGKMGEGDFRKAKRIDVWIDENLV